MSTEWGLIDAFIVKIPSVNMTTGAVGPAARQVVATEERAKQICEGHPARTYKRATEADLTDGEIANLKRARAAKEMHASDR